MKQCIISFLRPGEKSSKYIIHDVIITMHIHIYICILELNCVLYCAIELNYVLYLFNIAMHKTKYNLDT